jgi:ribosomal protein S18 acetylase RimI-like enzyme
MDSDPGKTTYHIRAAHLDEAKVIAEIRVKTWRTTYQGMIPDSVLEKLSVDESEKFTRQAIGGEIKKLFTLVCVDQNEDVIGFVIAGKRRADDAQFDAEIFALYVLKSHQGQGAGRMLMMAAVGRLVQTGYQSMLIWVLAGNPAIGFYQHLGGKAVREKQDDFDGKTLIEIGLGWTHLEPSFSP